MRNVIHFISGMPRAGSTLLAAILRQNPRFRAGIISPTGSLVSAVLRDLSQNNETSLFVDDRQREAILRGVFSNDYDAGPGKNPAPHHCRQGGVRRSPPPLPATHPNPLNPITRTHKASSQ